MNPAKTIQIENQVRKVILTDFARLMEIGESPIGKFILVAVGIEFLGACLDKQHLNAMARSEKRFNSAIRELFPKKYHHFTKLGSVPYLYTDFRCPVIHQFKSGKTVSLCSRVDGGSSKHLSYDPEGSLILVAEDFYEDLANAARAMIIRQFPG